MNASRIACMFACAAVILAAFTARAQRVTASVAITAMIATTIVISTSVKPRLGMERSNFLLLVNDSPRSAVHAGGYFQLM